MINETEMMEISVDKNIETKLIQQNVTQAVLADLKSRYGGMKLAAIDDKESYLDLKSAAKECAKLRNLAVKVCTEGRAEAIKQQKAWIAAERSVVNEIAEVENPIDSEIALFDNNIKRLEAEEKERQEAAYINRQATLSKMGARYEDGCFILGEAAIDAIMIKGSDDEDWNNHILPNFTKEHEKIEGAKIAEQQKKDAEVLAFKKLQEEMAAEKAAMQKEIDEMNRMKAEMAADKKAMEDAATKNQLIKTATLQRARFDKLMPYLAHGEEVEMSTLFEFSEAGFDAVFEEKKAAHDKYVSEKLIADTEKRLQDIEDAKAQAIKNEQARQAKEAADKIESDKQEAMRKQEQLDAARDNEKWAEFIGQIDRLTTYTMKSSYYRKKMAIAIEKIEEIKEI